MANEGLDAFVELFTETTYGTTPGSGGQVARIVSESWQRQADMTQGNRGLGRVMPTGLRQHLRRSGGSLVFDCQYEGLERVLLHFLGGVATSGPTDGAAYTHTFTPSLSRPVGLSLKINRSTSKAVFPGVKITGLDFNISQEVLEMTVSGVGKQGSEETATTGSGYSSSPDVLAIEGTNGLTVKVGGGAVDHVAARLSLGWPHVENREMLGDSEIREPKVSDFLSVSGTLTREFDDTNRITEFLAGTQKTIEFNYKSDEVITGAGITTYEWRMKVFAALFQKSSDDVGGPGPITDEVDFVALPDSSGNIFEIVLVNGTTSVS